MATTRTAEDEVDSVAVFNLALEHMHRSHFVEAARALEEALRRSPGNPEYISFLGLCLARGREYDTGIRLCKRALSRKPFETILHVNLGKVYRLMGDNAAAHRAFSMANSWNEKDPQAVVELVRMGVRRSPVLTFLPRCHWCNRYLGRIRARVERILRKDPSAKGPFGHMLVPQSE
jgi:Flp pilus assembly protein TadD